MQDVYPGLLFQKMVDNPNVLQSKAVISGIQFGGSTLPGTLESASYTIDLRGLHNFSGSKERKITRRPTHHPEEIMKLCSVT